MSKCPNCGGELEFDIVSQQLSCHYCGSFFDPAIFENGKKAEEHEGYDEINGQGIVTEEEALNGAAQDVAQDLTGEPEDMKVIEYSCPQCGGTLYSTEQSFNGFCSYCGSNHVLKSRMAKMAKPRKIIPFRQTKESVKEAYGKSLKKAIFAPKELRDPEYLDRFRGIYMPYWIYDVEVVNPAVLKGTKVYRRGDYVYTDTYSLEAEMEAYYGGLSYDASASFDDHFSELIAPFDAHQMVDFNENYISGYYADMQDVDHIVYQEDAEHFLESQVSKALQKDSNFSGLTVAGNNITVRPKGKEDAYLAFFPVWFLSYQKNDRVAYAVVNGQTGKVACDLPVVKWKFFLSAGILSVIIFALLNMFVTFTPRIFLGIGATLSLISTIILHRQHKRLVLREQRLDDRGYLQKYRRHEYKMQEMSTREEYKKREKTRVKAYKGASDFFSTAATWMIIIGLFAVNNFSDSIVSVVFMVIVAVIGVTLLTRMFTKNASKYDGARDEARIKAAAVSKEASLTLVTIPVVLSIIYSAAVFVLKPVSDLYYYGGVIAMLICVVVSQVVLLNYQNRLAMKPLPQLNRKGGDDSAV